MDTQLYLINRVLTKQVGRKHVFNLYRQTSTYSSTRLIEKQYTFFIKFEKKKNPPNAVVEPLRLNGYKIIKKFSSHTYYMICTNCTVYYFFYEWYIIYVCIPIKILETAELIYFYFSENLRQVRGGLFAILHVIDKKRVLKNSFFSKS